MFDDTDRSGTTALRLLAADAVQQANSGHPGLPLGAADIAYVLWARHLKYNPADPSWPDRDRFVLSAGHGSALLYALLHLYGYPMPLEELQRFRQWDSHTPGHPEYDPARGVETTTGPLGQGFGNAVGLALAERMLAARFNRPGFEIVDHFTYVVASDGDLMEGISHESASLAGFLGLGKLVVLYDDNRITIDGPTDLSYGDDVPGRFAAYNWHVQSVDGHDLEAIDSALKAARQETGRPSLIDCRTHIGYRSPRQDTAKVHGSPLGEEDLRKTKAAFGWPEEARFFVPEEVRERAVEAGARGAAKQSNWQSCLEGYRTAHPELAQAWDRFVNGELPSGWVNALPEFDEGQVVATRVASGKVLDAVAPQLLTLVGGSADLTPSNNTLPKGASPVRRDDFEGMYVHFGVREHGMGALLNGLALHGLRPYGGTFLIFSDYMRPAIRLAAMMGLPVIYVFTHDSIGLGEDGPTHQPVEHLTALRAIPNLLVLRPADARETVAAWKVALERVDGPSALVLTRQDLPVVTPAEPDLARGAYILSPEPGSRPDLVLIATGSEVSLAMQAQDALSVEGLGVRVVSMPSWELFDAQPEAYRESVLPPDVPRMAIESGRTLAWGHYLDGAGGAVLGLDRFGGSAPYKVLFEKFGFTVENVVARAREILAKQPVR